MRIHAALMCMNELSDLEKNVALLLPHVDTITIVDGGSNDATIPTLRNWSRADSKVRFFINPWRDNFPEQRNNYLRRVREIAADGDWILAVDPDEFLSDEALHELRRLADVVQRKREAFRLVGLRCRSVSLQGPNRVWSNEDNYWKGLYFRWSPQLIYSHHGKGAVHEILNGAGPMYQTGKHPEFPALFYEHRKQRDIIWPRGARNCFIGGGGPNLGSDNASWVELRAITDRLGIREWPAMHRYLIAGNVDVSLRDWMIRHRRETGYDGASEVREFYKTYFRLYHPEQEPAELRSEVIE